MEKLGKMGFSRKSIYKNKLSYQDFCLKCSKKLLPSQEVITIEYITTKPATVNLHPNCYKGKLRTVPLCLFKSLSQKLKSKKWP